MLKRFWIHLILPIIIILFACNQNNNKSSAEYPDYNRIQKIAKPELTISRDDIRKKVCEKIIQSQNTSLKESFLTAYYSDERSAFLWISKCGINPKVDTLFHYLENADKQHGINPELFSVDEVKQGLAQIKELNIEEENDINSVLADIEYKLSRDYLNYACFVGYGMIDPQAILNNMEDEEPINGKTPQSADGENKKKTFYSIPLEKYNRNYLEDALKAVQTDLPAFLQSLQPKSPFYASLQKEYARMDSLHQADTPVIPEIGTVLLNIGDQDKVVPLIAQKLSNMGYLSELESNDSTNLFTQELLEAVNAFRDKHNLSRDVSVGSFTIRALNRPAASYKRQIRLNMERLRWKPKQEKDDKYVWVNVAAFMLQAIETTNDSILEMRICCGTPQNKTPLLSGKIHYMELNPYWNVPKSIIRKEMIPAYQRDTAYFRKNKLRIYDKNGNELNPHSIRWSKYRGDVPFEIKQDNKEESSLGRIIFRFPNNFSVYLHDTPSRWSFMKTNRAVSHGCIRVEQPLDLAFFLLTEKEGLLMDRIRVAMGLAAGTEEGKTFTNKKGYKDMKYHILKQDIPVFLDYYTLHLSKNGKLSYCEDIYNFDEPLIQVLDSMNNLKD